MVRYAGRFATGAIYPTLIALATALLIASCSKDTQDTDESPGGKPPTALGPGEITSFRLGNGINVYLREDRSRPQVAVVALYRAGVIHEDAGDVHVSRVLPHMLIFSPTVGFGADGAVDAVSKTGRANGEVFGDFVRFDYTAAGDQLELLFKVEAERLTSVEFKKDQLNKYATKCRDDVDTVLEKPALSMSKYGLMALNQALNHGITSVPIYDGVYDVTTDDLERFRAARYRLADMVLVVVGDFETAAATKLIKKYFRSIEKRPPTVEAARPTGGDITANWDVESTVMFLVYPGPYQNEQERLVLTMFGTYMSRQLKADAELNRDLRSSLCSSTLHPVGDIPFFVFAQTRRGRRPQDIRPKIVKIVNESIQSIDAKTFDTMKGRLASFLRSSILESQRTISSMPHYKVLGQEALNIGTRHYVRNGLATEEFLEMVNAITYEDARRYLDSRLAPEQMRAVTFRGQ